MALKVLVIAAHPDDEVLGCGGTIARHALAGDRVDTLILAEGVTSRDAARDSGARSSEISDLRTAAARAADVLGARQPLFGSFPDNRMDTVALLDVVKEIEQVIARLEPHIVYTHFAGDLNVDHRVINQAVMTACRPLPGHCVERVLFFEVMSSTEWQAPASSPVFAPTWFVDISETLALKRQALEVYQSEMRRWPHARSERAVESLARYRGATIGSEAAEAFVLARMVVRVAA